MASKVGPLARDLTSEIFTNNMAIVGNHQHRNGLDRIVTVSGLAEKAVAPLVPVTLKGLEGKDIIIDMSEG